jgi:PKD domain-containing protein
MSPLASIRSCLFAGVGCCSLVAVASAATWPLACQARVPYVNGDTWTFQALAGNGMGSYTFAWDFGDGGTSTEQNPSHTYTATGNYPAVLTVMDANVPPETCRDTVLVFVGIAYDPPCMASANVRWATAPMSVAFSANPVFVGGEPGSTWSWSFGNGETSDLQSPSETYPAPGTYWAVATAHTPYGSFNCFPTVRVSALGDEAVGVDPPALEELRLDAARPNPFRTMTFIAYRIPRPGRVRLTIADTNGRIVSELANDYRSIGPNIAIWQGRDAAGHRVPPGVYFARLEYEGGSRTKRVVRL